MNRNIFTGLFGAAAIWLLTANMGYAQSCDYSNGQNDDWIFNKRCAPVTVERIVTFRGVDDGGTGNVSIYFDWGDGSDPEIISASELTTGNWQASATHIYPKNGDRCNYYAEAFLMVDGVLCTSSGQGQTATVWDIDNENGGELNISPVVFPICVGNDGSVRFTDVSQWNCTPPDEEDTPNNKNRWTQWIYGTGSTSIIDATVGGVGYSWPHRGSVEYYPEPAEAPAPPPSTSEEIYIPDYYNVGDFFEVTIRNWNTCNPYNEDPATPPGDPINGDNPPVTTTAMALIVAIPDGSVDPAGPFCETDAPYTLVPATPGGTWSGPGVDPSTGEFTPVAAGPGTHTITYNVSNAYGCSASGSIDIEVREAPSLDITPGTSIYLCPGLDLQLNAAISGGTPPYSIQWTGDTAPLSATNITNPDFNTTNTGSFNLTATVTDDTGCSNQANITIDIEEVSIVFDPNPIEVCAGETVELSPITDGGSTVFTSHTWSGSDTDKLSATDVANPEFSSTETGTFTYTYTVIDDKGCSDQTDISVIVKEQPVADAGPDEQLCSLTHQLNSNEVSGATGLWQVISGPGNISFDDASSTNATITADTYGVYELSREIDLNGCTSTDVVTVTFSESPSPSAGEDIEVCGLSTSLEAIPDFGTGSWSMTTGPGSATFTDASAPTTAVAADTPGQYLFTWTETSADNCTGSAVQTVNFLPQAEASLAPFTTEACSPLEITFENTSVNAQTYEWDFGDGAASTQENPTHIFRTTTNSPETFDITFTAKTADNCNDTKDYQITVNPIPQALFETSDLAGCSPMSVTLNNQSSGATGYTWDFGDGSDFSEEETPSHTYTNQEAYVQSFRVNLTAENDYGCTDSYFTYITVYPVREIELTATPEEGCSPLTSQLLTQSGAKSYYWNFGDGSTETGSYQTAHTFVNNTQEDISYEISVTGTSSFGCPEEAATMITVHPTPSPDFTATPTEQQMPDRTVSVNNTTTGQWNYLWSFGDGTTSEATSPEPHQYEASGDYEISLRAYSDFCEATTSELISILPMMPAIDYGQDESGCPPLTVSFYNNTLDATSYLWEFGDGQSSNEHEPKHTYRVPGTYPVRLTAYGPGGTITAEEVTIQIYNTPTALFEPVPKVVYIPDDEVTFLNKSQGADFWEWSFGDGNSSVEFSPTHSYASTGSYDVTLRVENSDGCTDEITIPDAVKAEQGGEIDFPNAFTPNKNGPTGGQYQFGERTNHVFYPFVQKGIVEYKLQIFSRWGELLFETTEINRGWDGYYRDKLAPQGVYIWRVTATMSDGKRIEKAGDVTLLR
ncbi:PKD domain-containing protein [Marinilabilia salmonicolor]|nr:PKD domain-containing protein [Marinilabilia salmonicolor]